ncbi:hypothetical protein [Brevundimonas sp.]|uniref:hypothetical protein n=1 Tax=Brevundimonas sp. TaxID=1871086 RepID=UPI00286A9BF9|nr:hypothetical protein [Brevundimonas sp.]
MPAPTVLLRPSALVLAATALLLSGCEREEAATPPPTTTPPTAEPAAAPAAPAPTLDRAGLLQAMDAAASAYAAGRAPEVSLAGRRFIIREAFGCAGETAPPVETAPGNGLATWSWGLQRESLKLVMAPGDWTDSPLLAGGADSWEAAEGFWISRPWLRGDGCPAVGGDPLASGPVAPSPQSVGLAAVFEQDGSRLGRRNGRAYAFTVRGEGEQPPAAPVAGYRLVLEGRMAAFADGRAIRCRAASIDQRPVCIGAVQLDRVAFETADGANLSEWRVGG